MSCDSLKSDQSWEWVGNGRNVGRCRSCSREVPYEVILRGERCGCKDVLDEQDKVTRIGAADVFFCDASLLGRKERRTDCDDCEWSYLGIDDADCMKALREHQAEAFHGDNVKWRETMRGFQERGPGIVAVPDRRADHSVAFLDEDLLCGDAE